MNYSQLLDQYIRESGLSLAKIAEKMKDEKGIKIDRSYLSKLRNNPKYPASEDINRALAEVLDKDPEALVTAAYYETAPEEIKRSLDRGIDYERLIEAILDKSTKFDELSDDLKQMLEDLSKAPKETYNRIIVDSMRNVINTNPGKFNELYLKSQHFEKSGITEEEITRLKNLRKQKGYSVKEMAAALAITERQYEILENIVPLKLDKNDVEMEILMDVLYQEGIRFLEKAEPKNLLEVYNSFQNTNWVVEENQISKYNPSAMVRIPVLGSIVAGEPIERLEHNEGYTLVDPEVLKGAKGFALRVKGDSMSGDNIYDGFVVIVRAQPEVYPHEIAVVAVNGQEATLKRVRYLDSKAILTPSNPVYDQKVYDAKDVNVIGKVVEVKFWPK